MRSFVRRYGWAASLCVVGLALLLAGTAASLGYIAHAGKDQATPAPVAAERASAGGLALDASVAVDAPLVPLDPVHYSTSIPGLTAAPLPGASVRRELGLDKAGLGIEADLDLAAGSHRASDTRAGDAQVSTATSRAVLVPGAEAAVVAAAALTFAGALVYFWSAIKSVATRVAFLPAIALYAKISRAEVFDNQVRERIFAAIRERPGLSASDLSRVADVSWGTTIYHLDVLEQTRMVSSLRNGRYRRYFENGAALTTTKEVVSVLQNPVTAGVVDTIRRSPGATQKELAAATSMTPQALHWHLARLVTNGLVRKVREGRVVRHFVAAN